MTPLNATCISETTQQQKENNDNGCVQHKDIKGHAWCACACPGYGKVCPCQTELAKRAAARATTTLYQNSAILFHSQPPTFHVYRGFDQLEIGKKLGAGGFCQVHEVTVKDDEEGSHSREDRNTQPHKKKYAIKFLKKTTMVDKQLYLQGSADLATEASFLSALTNARNNPDGKYVVRLHGIADGIIKSSGDNYGMDRLLFLIMDQLNESLEQRIERWIDDEKPMRGFFNIFSRIHGEYQEKRQLELRKRLSDGLQVAEAMQFLHSMNLVYRDLKPENVGFDSSEKVKLYDFGLAKELKDSQKVGEGSNYKMTGGAGSVRYMAPEVVLCQPYNASIDVYSFGILLCEIARLKKAFQGYDANDHMQQVVKDGQRPHTEYWFPEALQTLLEACWAPDATKRPPFQQVVKSLKAILETEPEQPEPSISKSLGDFSYEVFR